MNAILRMRRLDMTDSPASEKHIRMATKLYEMRDVSKRLLGPLYAEAMQVYGDGIKAMAEKNKSGALEAAIELSKKADDEFEVMYIIAAAVELTEPSV